LIFYFYEPFHKKLKNSLINKRGNIIFEKVDYKIPEKINDSKLFYNRTNIPYAFSSFPKSRVGFFDMFFLFNIIDQKLSNIKSQSDLNIPSSLIPKFHWEHHAI